MTFAIVGHGTVGRATRAAAEFHGHECVAVVDPSALVEVPTDAGLAPAAFGNPCAADLVFVCVPTPSADDGSCDTSVVESACEDLWARGYYGTVVVRSTVPPGTMIRIAQRHRPDDMRRFLHNPEFLRRRDSEHTSRWPAFVLIGACDIYAGPDRQYDPHSRALEAFYQPFFEHRVGAPICVTNWRTSEFYKYASNALLAATVTLADELYTLARASGADWETCYSLAQLCPVTPKTIRVDPEDRGFAGPCLPKDLAALVEFGKTNGVRLPSFERIQAANVQVRAEQERLRNHPPDGRLVRPEDCGEC